ncbi:MAG: DUF1565 domain-containing protein [Candidatus Binatia bacterium]
MPAFLPVSFFLAFSSDLTLTDNTVSGNQIGFEITGNANTLTETRLKTMWRASASFPFSSGTRLPVTPSSRTTTASTSAAPSCPPRTR